MAALWFFSDEIDFKPFTTHDRCFEFPGKLLAIVVGIISQLYAAVLPLRSSSKFHSAGQPIENDLILHVK